MAEISTITINGITYDIKDEVARQNMGAGGGSDFSGDYNDLTNKPSIPSELSELASDTNHRTVTDQEKTTWNNKSNFSGSYNDLSNKPTIPSAVTETTVSEWGFTKNTGTYSKPSEGIPKTDLDANVQTSLGKADTALQSHQDISGKADKATTLSGYGITDALSSSLKGANSGLAELDANGKVPSSQLPSYVDDVLEYASKASFPIPGESGKIYVDVNANTTYRWSGSDYIAIGSSLAIGETSSTAYRGDRGKTAYDHSQATHARTDATKVEASTTNGNIKINGTETTVYTHPTGTNPHGTTKSDVGLGNVGNFKAVSTVASQGLTDTEKSNARTNIGAGTSSLTIGTTATTAAAGNHTHSNYLTSHQDISGKVDKTTAGVNDAINLLTEGTSDPQDNDFYIAQYAGGGTSNTSYHRRPISKIWNYIKSKIGVSKGSATQPIYIDENGTAQACTYSLNKTVPSDAKFTDTNTTNTAGSTDTSSKIYLVGATSQAASPQTYSDNQVYATNGQLDANKMRIGEAVTLQYDSTNKCLNFVFA